MIFSGKGGLENVIDNSVSHAFFDSVGLSKFSPYSIFEINCPENVLLPEYLI